MTSLRQIAERCGVSVATVSAALNGREQGVRRDASERAQRIRSVAVELGYRPQAAAKALRSRRTGAIGLLVMNHRGPAGALSHPNQYEFVLGATLELAAQGLGTVLIPMDGIAEPGSHQVFQQRMLDGLIACGQLSPVARERALGLGVPVLWTDGEDWAASGCLRRDEVAAGRATAALAQAAGYQRLLLLGPAGDHWWQRERARGLSAGGLVVERVPAADGADWAALLARLDGRTAVVTETAYLAAWLIARAALDGLRLGRDLPCVACESSASLERACPALSRVRFDRQRLGIEAATMLVSCLSEETHPPSRLVADGVVAGDTLPPVL